MNIVLVNKFYYPRGGDCIYTINLEKLLKDRGHRVAVFSMQHPDNLENDYKHFWPSLIDYSKPSSKNFIEKTLRPIYSLEIKSKFKRLIDFFKPDLIHLNNIHTQLSPIIAEIAFYKSIPVVWTLHDYKLICPAYTFLRNDKICELCLINRYNVIKHKCIKNNLPASIIGYVESLRWNKNILQKYTKYFISPSNFLRNKMLEAGFNKEKIVTISNFIDDSKFDNAPIQKENYYCYIGRLSREKGIETLLEIATRIENHKLIVIGSGPLENDLKKKFCHKNIKFLGHRSYLELKGIVRKARFTVVPSRLYENYPMSIIETFALNTTAIGAQIGGIPELIIDGKTGLLFESGNKENLEYKIKNLISNEALQRELSDNAYKFVKENNNSEVHYDKLIDLYKTL